MNLQQKLNLLDAAWQTARNTRRDLDWLLQTNPHLSRALKIAIYHIDNLETNLDSLRELIQEEI